jgi:Dual-action HEIGH metallo-peptidase
MKQLISYMAATLLLVALFASCAKDNQDAAQQVVSQEVLAKIAALGFSTENVQIIEEGYLVENDIVLHEHDLEDAKVTTSLIIAETEQYHTTNTVTGLPRQITISSSGSVNANVSSAIDVMIARYNAKNLALTFQRVPSGGTINIKVVNGGNYIASAGFPSGGNPYPEVKFNKQYQNWQNATLASVFAHEVGHCIGYRHTDYMDRSYSCGGAASNEGAGSVGAIHISGTPTGPDAGSWMLACIGDGIDRPFNGNDVTALNYLY